MSDPLRQFFLAGPLPAGMVALVLVPTWLAFRGRDERSRARWFDAAAALGLTIAAIASHLALHGRPEERWETLVAGVAAGGMAGTIAAFFPRTWPTRVISAALAAILVTLTLRPAIEHAGWILAALPGAAILVLGSLLPPATARRPTWLAPAGLGLALFAFVPVTILSGNLEMALVPAAVGAGVGVVFLVGLFARDSPAGVGLVLPAATALGAVGPVAWYYQFGLPPEFAWAFPLAAASPLAAWVGEIPPWRKASGLAANLARLVPIAIVAGAAVVLAANASDVGVYVKNAGAPAGPSPAQHAGSAAPAPSPPAS